MEHTRPSRAVRDYADNALTRALFKANARRRCSSTPPPSNAAQFWPVAAAVLLVLILCASLVVLVEVIITQTRPLPAPPGEAALWVELPAQLTDPHTLISFTPVSDPWYYTSVAFQAQSLEVRTGQTGSSIDSTSATAVDPKGKKANIGSWIQPDTWKVLIQVTGTGTLPRLSAKPGNPQLLYVLTINDNTSYLLSHFLTGTTPGCGLNPTIWPLNNYQANGEQIQAQWIYPCKGEATGECSAGVGTKKWCIAGEAVLTYPVESEATGHVAGMLPVIDVGYRQADGNIRATPYQVIVAGDRYTPGGIIAPGLQEESISPATTSADSLSWQADGILRATWSWTVIADVNQSEQVSNICLILVGVLSSALVAILGYLVKLLITRTPKMPQQSNH